MPILRRRWRRWAGWNPTRSPKRSYGWQDLLQLLALITINLGIFNLLPFPALDGGKVVFLLIEGVTGHAVPEKIQSGLTVAAFALLFGLMIFATYNDILRLITGAM